MTVGHGIIVNALACLAGVRSVAIDGELVACDDAGVPNFYALHFHSRNLLHHNGRDLRKLPLLERKARLEKLAPI